MQLETVPFPLSLKSGHGPRPSRSRVLGVLPAMLCCVQLIQSCPILCDPVDCSPPASSVHGILQARILEWVAMPSSRGSSQPRDLSQVSHIAGGFFSTRKAEEY